jgi:hypothetical protein
MTLRQLWVRFRALPYDAPIWAALEEAREKRAELQQVRDIDDTLAMFQPPTRGRDDR